MRIEWILFLLMPTLLFSEIGVLKSVVDGDTLYFRSAHKLVKCRIAYIDTFESKRNAKAIRDAKKCRNLSLSTMITMGSRAAKYAASIVHIGESYRYDVIGRDHYNRSVCIVHTPDGIFNELMVQEGYALPYYRYIPPVLQKKYRRLTAKAKQRKKGLWMLRNLECR